MNLSWVVSGVPGDRARPERVAAGRNRTRRRARRRRPSRRELRPRARSDSPILWGKGAHADRGHRQELGAGGRVRPVRDRPGRGVPGAPLPGRLAGAGLRRRDGLPGADGAPAGRRPAGGAVGPIGRRARHGLQHRSSLLDRGGRPGRGDRLALRLGRGLPRRPRPPHGGTAGADARGGRRAVRGALLRGYRPRAGACLRAVRRDRLDRQEHVPHPPREGLVALPVGDHHQPAARRRRAAGRPVRHLHALPGGVPDRCLSRAVGPGRHALPVVPDHRAARTDPRGTPLRRRDARLRLRHLPGRLPVQRGAGALAGPGMAARARTRRAAPRRPLAPVGPEPRRAPRTERDVAGEAGRTAPQRRRRPRQQRDHGERSRPRRAGDSRNGVPRRAPRGRGTSGGPAGRSRGAAERRHAASGWRSIDYCIVHCYRCTNLHKWSIRSTP